MASFASLVSLNDKPTAFGTFDDDLHFQEDADKIILYVKRRLGDDIMSVELTNRQIWTNFEEACLEFSKNVNAHQAESYMSNLLGLKIGPTETFKKNSHGHYYWNDVDIEGSPLLIQDTFDPRFQNANFKGKYVQEGDTDAIPRQIEAELDNNSKISASPILDKRIGPHGKEQKFPRETHEYLIRRAEPYASEAFVGGVSNSEVDVVGPLVLQFPMYRTNNTIF